MSTTRVDQVLGNRDRLFGRFTMDEDDNTAPRDIPTTDNTCNTVYGLYIQQSVAGSWIHSFSPTFLSETLVTFSREHKVTSGVDVPSIPNLADFLGMPNPQHNPFTPFTATGPTLLARPGNQWVTGGVSAGVE